MHNNKILPLKHINKLNLSSKNFNKINIVIQSNKKGFDDLFELSGEFPTYISFINQSKNFNFLIL